MKKILIIVIIAFVFVVIIPLATLWIWGGGDGIWRHEMTVIIEAKPEQVFPFLTEPDKLRQWMGGLVESEPLSDEGVKVGARSKDVIEQDGHRTEMVTEITELEPGRLIVVHVESEDFQADVRYSLAPVGNGTELQYVCHTEFYPFVFRLLEPLIGIAAEKKLIQDFATLKKAVEG